MGEGVAPIPTSGGHQRYPSTDQDPKVKGGSETDPSDDIHKAASLPSKDPYSTSTLTIDAGLGTCTTANPPWGFSGVTACLHVPKLVEVDLEPPVSLMPMELVAAPGITSVSSSHIIKDELMGVTYMDMVTISVGRVTISGPGL